MQLFRNRNIANTFWNISDIFLYPVLFFGSTAFFIRKLGEVEFGIWMLINTIAVSMQVFNFGVGANVFRNVAFHEAQHNDKGKGEVMNNSISLTLVLAGISLLCAAVVAYLVYAQGLLHVAPASRNLCCQGIVLAGFIVGFKFFEQVFTSYFKAREQFNKSMLLSSGNKLIALLLNIGLLALLPLNIVHLLLVMIGVNTVFLLLSLGFMYRDFKGYRFSFNLKLPKQEAHFAFFTWLQSLAVILAFQSDRYLVVNFFGLAVLSYYAITATIFNHLHMGLNAIFPWLSPKLTRLHAKNADVMELYTAARNLLVLSSVAGLLLLFLLYPLVLRWILGAGTLAQISDYVRYFIVFELFFAQSIVPTFYFNATGQERKYFYLLLFFALLALGCMLGGVLVFHQPVAVLYGLIVACAVFILVQHIVLHRVAGIARGFGSAFLLLLPSVLISGFILVDDPLIRWLTLSAGVLSLYFIYVRGNLPKFKLLLRS